MRLRTVSAVMAVCVTATAFAAVQPSGAAPGDRTISGTVVIDWGSSVPIAAPDFRVEAKSCVTDGTAAQCFTDSTGWTPAHETATPDTYEYTLNVDSTLQYVVIGRPVIDLDPTPEFAATKAFIPEAPQFVPPGDPGLVELSPYEYDTSYVRLQGTASHDDVDAVVGVGACPAGNPLVNGTCDGLRLTTADQQTGDYGLNLWPGDWRAAGYVIAEGTAVLGVVNVLDLPPPTTVAEAVRDLDFDANVAYNSRAVEDGAPNGGDGNSDGTMDSLQPSVTSVVNEDGEYITIVVNGGIVGAPPVATAVVQPFVALFVPPPDDTILTGGVTSFTIGPVPSETPVVQVDLVFHIAPPAGTDFWKFLDGAWAPYTTELVSESPYTLRVLLTDGGAGDYDQVVNNYITDPFALAPPSLVLGALEADPVRKGVSLSWTLTDAGQPVATFPAGGSLVAVCKGKNVDLTSAITGTGGTFSAVLKGAARCSMATVTVPRSATPGEVLTSSVVLP